MSLLPLKRVYWDIRKQPDATRDILLSQFIPSVRRKRKYDSELGYWRSELANLRRWFVARDFNWWGVPPPAEHEKLSGAGHWVTDALATLHRIYPACLEEILIEANALHGQRVLEVGCGPAMPLLQFHGCERHGIDPLIGRYMKAGWPIFDYDARIIEAFGEAMPYPDRYFDVVMARNALDHVDDFGQVAAEISRVLKPGGRFYCYIEYHAPTLEEPQQLDDAAVSSAFSTLQMEKRRERSKDELNADLATRFNLSLPDLVSRAGTGGDSRYVVWHGRKPVAG
jgi:SAM-dependent methyltransferase